MIGIKLLTRLRLGFSHLGEQIFKHFQKTSIPFVPTTELIQGTYKIT